MFGCLFRFIRLIVVLAVIALLVGGVLYYTRLYPGRVPWKDGASAVKDKVATMSLEAQVKAALSLRESLKGLDISVSAEKDVVTLRGKAPSGEVARTVESVASSVPGVRQVVNFLEVDAMAGKRAEGTDDRSIGEKVDDEALELKIRAAFRLDKTLQDAGFEVKAMRRAIQLSSFAATEDQKERAFEVAGSVEGVSKVEVR